jgi:hypothetical protein
VFDVILSAMKDDQREPRDAARALGDAIIARLGRFLIKLSAS